MSEPNSSGEARPPDPPPWPAHAAPEVPTQPAPTQPAPVAPPPAAQPAHAAPDMPLFLPGSAGVPSPPASPAAGYGPPASPAGYGPPSTAESGASPAEPTVSMASVGQYPAPPQYASPPVSGTPYGAPAYAGAPAGPAAGAPRRGRGFLVATILAVLLFLAAGTMTGLYIAKTGEMNKTKKTLTAQVNQRDTKITDQTGEIDKLKKDVQATKDEMERVKQDLSGTQNAADELKRQKGVISRCLNLLAEASYLADQGQTSQARAKLNEAKPVCDEADRYLE